MKPASQMCAALEAVDDAACSNDAPYCGCCAARIKPAIAGRQGITDEMVARMDWAAALTEDDERLIKRGLRLAFRATEEFGAREDEDRIARLLEGLEALP